MTSIREALGEYEVEMESRDYAEETRKHYRNSLKRFAAVCETVASEKRRQPLMATITADMVSGYFAGCVSVYRYNDDLSAVRAFFRWAIRMRYMSTDHVALILGERKRRKTSRKPKHYIGIDEFGAALDIAEERHPHDRAVISLALYTLCRQSELTGLRLKHVDLLKRELTIYRPKTRRWTMTVISPDLEEELSYWLAWYAEDQGYMSARFMMAANPDWYLLPRRKIVTVQGKDGRFGQAGHSLIYPEMPSATLELVVKPVLDGLGVEGEHGFSRRHLGEGLHTIRRSGARALLDYLAGDLGQDRALLQVSAMLNHEDPQQTLLYIGRDIEKDRLDSYLRGHSMYGDRPSNRGTVRQLRGPEAAQETQAAPRPGTGLGASVRAV